MCVGVYKDMVDKLADVGGIFALLVLVHFVGDWVFQSHLTATTKNRSFVSLMWHSTWYTVWCLTFLMPLENLDPVRFMCAGCFLLSSHLVIDTYWPLALWAKYLRKMPEPNDPRQKEAWISSPMNPILFITVDQIFHMVCLLPVAAVVVL